MSSMQYIGPLHNTYKQRYMVQAYTILYFIVFISMKKYYFEVIIHIWTHQK